MFSGMTLSGFLKKYMHHKVKTNPKKNKGDHNQLINKVIKQNIMINGRPVGCIGTKTLFLIESNIDIFLKPMNINVEYYNV
tara:strand:+ start:2853 stop:3095 length:243 start_codon:yes stop_codon:yes gene_type:complete